MRPLGGLSVMWNLRKHPLTFLRIATYQFPKGIWLPIQKKLRISFCLSLITCDLLDPSLTPYHLIQNAGERLFMTLRGIVNFFKRCLRTKAILILIKEFKIKPLTPELIVFKKYYGTSLNLLGM